MSILDAQKLIGQVGEYSSPSHPGLAFTVVITDVKMAYSTWRVQVSPVAGRGMSWMNYDSLRNVREAVPAGN